MRTSVTLRDCSRPSNSELTFLLLVAAAAAVFSLLMQPDMAPRLLKIMLANVYKKDGE